MGILEKYYLLICLKKKKVGLEKKKEQGQEYEKKARYFQTTQKIGRPMQKSEYFEVYYQSMAYLEV